jgi:phosphoribosylamine---glycine ligase
VKVCVVGSGGREDALATAFGISAEVVVSPGNPGMERRISGAERISISAAPPEEIEADLFVIGPEAPLVGGLADRLRADGKVVFGPGADGARLEGSKSWMKKILCEAGVPSARYGSFTEPFEAIEFLRSMKGPWVVKTDGLASGKGVLVTESLKDAEADVIAKTSGKAFGEAGRRVVIEEGLAGLECTVHVLCDGKTLLPLVAARDYKRAGDSDTGPNTGGMGAVSPVVEVTDDLIGRVIDECVEPLVAKLRAEGIDYKGALYAGLMLTDDGPKVLEYNVRFGDPETQVIVARTPDLAELVYATATGTLAEQVSKHQPENGTGAAVCVVLAAEGYPESPRTGDPISGAEDAAALQGITVAYAGVGESNGMLVTGGGRVLGITGTGDTVDEARERAYAGCACVKWDGMHYRNDIASNEEVR